MKTHGDGSISKLRNGRFWVRGPLEADGKTRKSLGTYATREEAEQILAAALAMRGEAKATRASSLFVNFGRSVLDLREEDGYRSVQKERGRFELHIANSSLANMALDEMQPRHAAEFARALMRKPASDKRARRRLSTKTAKRALSICNAICREACLRGLMATNPFAGLEIRKRADEDESATWTFLSLAEQRALATCDAIPYVDRVILRCAIGSGLRMGELANNYLDDLHLDAPEPFIFVRWGSRRGGKNLVPKNGKSRKVYLVADGLRAFCEWVEIRKTFLQRPARTRHEVRRDEGLLFPTVSGCRRGHKFFGNGWHDPKHPRASENGWVDRLADYYERAGIEDRPGLHFHALRHTCATSLLEGFWVAPWSIEAVSEQLGHSSIAVTQRYAHPSGVRLRAEVRRSLSGYALVTGAPEGDPGVAAIRNDLEEVGRAGHDPATYGLKAVSVPVQLRAVATDGSPLSGAGSPDTERLAASILRLVQDGNTNAALAAAVSLAEASISTRMAKERAG